MNFLLALGVLLQLVQIYRTPVATNIATTTTTFQNVNDGLRSRAQVPPPMKSPRDLRASFSTSQQAKSEGSGDYENQLLEQQHSVVRQRYDLNEWILDQEQAEKSNGLEGTDDMEDSRSPEPPGEPEPELPFQASEFNYSLPVKSTAFTLSIQPSPTNDSKLAVIVLSSRSNFDRRQAIRESWAKEHRNVYFVIGGPDPENSEDVDINNPNSTSSRLYQEQLQFRDILDTVHPESYRGLPFKLHYAIQWIGQHPGMKHITWVLKVDDDVVARLHTLQHYVLNKLNPLTPMVIGRMEPNSTPHRTGKWAEDPAMKYGTYPPWAYGSTGYVMSRVVIDYISSKPSLYYYQGEDVSLGLWLYESPLDMTWMDAPYFAMERKPIHEEDVLDHTYSVVIGHNLSPEALKTIFTRWQDPKPQRNTNHVNEKGFIFAVRPLSEEESGEEENMMGDDTWYIQANNRRNRERKWVGLPKR